MLAEPLGLALPVALLEGEALSDGEALSEGEALSDDEVLSDAVAEEDAAAASEASGVTASWVTPVGAGVASWVASFCAGAWFWAVFPQPTSKEALSSAAELKVKIFCGRFMILSIACFGDLVEGQPAEVEMF